jgi:hypothetical protein
LNLYTTTEDIMSQDINTRFSRRMLTSKHEEVRDRFPDIKPMSDAWVWNGGIGSRGNWEFHGPHNFFCHVGSAANAYEARYKGWSAYIEADERARDDLK